MPSGRTHRVSDTLPEPTPGSGPAWGVAPFAAGDVSYHLAICHGQVVQFDCHSDPSGLLGRKTEDFVANPKLLLEQLSAAERARILEEFRSILKSGRPRTIEHRLMTPQGQIRWVANTLQPLGQPDPELLLARGVLRDIGDRRLMLAALADAEDRLQVLLDNSGTAIVLLNAEGRVIEANRTAAKLFDCPCPSLLGWHLADLLTETSAELLPDRTGTKSARDWTPRMCERLEIVALRPNTDTFPAELTITPIPEQGLWTAVFADISERRALQSHVLETAAREQRRLGQELHDGIGQEVTGLSLLAAALNDLVNRGNTSPGLTGDHWERIRSITGMISRQLRETGHNLRNLAHGMMPVPIDPWGFQAAIEDLASGLNASGKVRCRVRLDADLRLKSATVATELYRIIQEALSNSIRHGQATRIAIVGNLTAHGLRLRIDDNGQGLPADQLSQTNGFGRRTMQYRASLIGGAVWWRSRPGGGTRVVCELTQGLEDNAGGDAKTALDPAGR